MYSYFGLTGRSRYSVIVILTLLSLFIYLYYSLSKLIVYFIYAVFAFVLFIFFQEYHFPITLIGTLLMIIHPLSNLEIYLQRKLDKNHKPLEIKFFKAYSPFYHYREEMKNSYHFDQVKKSYTERLYSQVRNATVLFLISVSLFLFINGLNKMAKTIDKFDIHLFFGQSYFIFMLFVLSLLLYKKGFRSTFRSLLLLIFPPLIYFIFYLSIPSTYKLIFGISIIIAALGSLGVFLFLYYQRVVYEYFYYFDDERNEDVYANSLFEKIAYNETFTLYGVYEINISLQNFQKLFEKVVVYANFYRFIIFAYTYSEGKVKIHTHFYYKKQKSANDFAMFLSKLYKTEVATKFVIDQNKLIFEEKFFHKPSYIKGRAVYLANLLKSLEIKKDVIIRITAYFEDDYLLKLFSNNYTDIVYIKEFSEEYHTIFINEKTPNIDYLIETKVQEILVHLMMYNGNFVRIEMFYDEYHK